MSEPQSKKFMQSVSPSTYKELLRIASSRGVTVQELLRAVVIPEWLRKYQKEKG